MPRSTDVPARPGQLHGPFGPERLRAALAEPAGDGERERGAVFTRPEVVAAMLDLAGYTADRPLHTWSILEPSFGAGDFLLTILDRLLAACDREGLSPAQARDLRDAIRAVEVHPASFAATHTRVHRRLLAWGASSRQATDLCTRWLMQGDFLLADIDRQFDVVAGNPPYVRQERIPTPLLMEYRRRYSTIYDRADLYVPFFERGLGLLREGGRLAFICADRWLKNRYGGPLRRLVARDYFLSHYIDMEDTGAFQSDVFAYPAITIIRRGAGELTRIARRPHVTRELPAIVREMTRTGPLRDARVAELARPSAGDAPWLLDAPERLRVLRSLERHFFPLEQVGCKVGIGVATGADRIFLGPLAELPVEDARKLPLAMAADLRPDTIAWSGVGIINPFEPDGSLADLRRYPQFAAHLNKHQTALRRRHVARRRPAAWYRTIDRIDDRLTTTAKLLIPDIKGEPVVVFDAGRYYPHHNLYHITASGWDLHALATVLRSSITVLFVSSYSTKLAGGFLRFQAQYLRRICLPRWDDLSAPIRRALIAADPADLEAIDQATFAAYGLSTPDATIVRDCRR